MLRGTRMEPEARQAYIDLTGIEVTPACVIHETYPWMRASLDGLSRDEKTAVEIKCVNKDDHRSAVEGLVPTKYWPQVQHQLLVTGLPRLHYWSFSTSTTFISENRKALVVVKADADYMSYLLEGEQKFWDDFLERTKK
jgi:putative phage-type endonuclease